MKITMNTPKKARAASPAVEPDSGETVLVIDDSQTILTYVNALLKDDYQLKLASTPEKGLALAIAEPRPDLILLDVIMPGMSGHDVCRQLKANPETAGIPVIFLTGMTNKEDEQTGFAVGAVDYITKPISGVILRARVRSHVRLKRAADFMKDMNEFLVTEVGKRTQALEDAMARAVDQSEQLNAIFDLSPDGFVAFDAAHTIKYASPAFYRMTGLLAEDIIGCDVATFVSRLNGICIETARLADIAALKVGAGGTATKAGGDKTSRDRPAERPRRQLIELASHGKPVLEVGLRESESGSVSQILYFRDVTHETEVDRMKSEFLSHAAHELRTPMASIYGYSELMLVQEFDAEERKELVGAIHRQSQLMISIINELLDLARIEARRGKDFTFQRVDVPALMQEIVSSFMPPDGRPKPAIQVGENACWVRADRKKLQQAINNVLSNAYKYSPNGGAVTVELAADPPGQLCLRVRDQGLGMTPQQVARVCERFYRADTSGKIPGTGLGMSIVREIIELHGGAVEIDSYPGKGSTVILRLPAANA